MTNDILKVLKLIAHDVLRIADAVSPATGGPTRKSAASVSSLSVESGVVREGGDEGDVPRQTEETMVKTPLGDRYRRVMRKKGKVGG